ncbi:hypothetical protein [Gaetbulibacter aestuarii]|uniref:Uncharacterized protein n=1 Tax=Gaetbulibacter aestuarii TaxID=1502358 RepID=A0ABW7N0F1_9FLAO
MKSKLFISLFLLGLLGHTQNPITIGKTATFHSNILNEDRPLDIRPALRSL